MDILKAEILKLGGNDEDFELVKDVEDPEDEEWKNPNKDLGGDFDLDEFRQFVQKLNFTGKVTRLLKYKICITNVKLYLFLSFLFLFIKLTVLADLD